MRLTKHHGLGNDFLVTFVDEVPADAPALATALCDRRTGIGADGLIFVTTDAHGGHAMVLRNSDGSAAELSGNGLRCLGQAIALRNDATEIDEVVQTVVGPRRIHGSGSEVEMNLTVEMAAISNGVAILEPFDAPGLPEVVRVGSGDIGNPHIVVEVPEPDDVDLALAGTHIEATYGPTNVHFVTRGADPDHLRIRVWERGAGITQACGTGACVAAHVAHEWGLVGNPTVVEMPGGSATVGLGAMVTLTGPTVYVGSIEVPRG